MLVENLLIRGAVSGAILGGSYGGVRSILLNRKDYFAQDSLIGLINGVALALIKCYLGPHALVIGTVFSIVSLFIVIPMAGYPPSDLVQNVALNSFFLAFGTTLGYLVGTGI